MARTTFTKVSLPNGWLSNMSPHPVAAFGRTWKTAEALFQACRFSDDSIREHIRLQSSPMGAKLAAKSRKNLMTVEPMSDVDLINMRFVLVQKVLQHSFIAQSLIETGDSIITEDCTRRKSSKSALFWGMAQIDNVWVGQNHLGLLWMEVRDELPVILEQKRCVQV